MSADDVAYVMEIDVEGSPKGEEFQIAGLGTFKNGETYEVTKEEADAYRTYHSRQKPILEEGTNAILGSELENGPTLLQAAKGMHGVKVSTPGSSNSGESDNEQPQDLNPPSGPEVSDTDENEEGGES